MSAVSTTDWIVETPLCKLRDTSDTLVGRAYCRLILVPLVPCVAWCARWAWICRCCPARPRGCAYSHGSDPWPKRSSWTTPWWTGELQLEAARVTKRKVESVPWISRAQRRISLDDNAWRTVTESTVKQALLFTAHYDTSTRCTVKLALMFTASLVRIRGVIL